MKILPILLLLLPFSVQAYQYKLAWNSPTERADGTPLPISEISHYDLYADGALLTAVPGGDTTIQSDMSPGEHCFAMKTVDTGGRESVFSNEVCKSLPSDAIPNSVIIDVTIIE